MVKNSKDDSKSLYELGDLVTYISNPFIKSINDLVIKAKSEYTPPIFVIFEINIPKNFSEHNGKKDIQYNCIFFNTKTCLFEKKWFKEVELKIVEVNKEKDSDQLNFFDAENDEKYLNNKYILKSVDYELKKLKSNYEKTENVKTKITANLDFVSPILTVLQVLPSESTKLYDTNSGERLRNSLLFKCKWFNSVKQTFSEEVLSSDILKSVEEYDISKNDMSFEIGQFYLFPESTSNGDLYELQDVVELLHISFNTYFYEFVYKSIFTQEINNLILNKENISEIKEVAKEEIFSDELIGINQQRVFKQITPSLFKKGNLYRIVYRDKMSKITKRIIYVNEVLAFNKSFVKVTLNSTQKSKSETLIDYHCYIEAYCLLRNGEKRHFILNPENILSVKKFLPSKIKY